MVAVAMAVAVVCYLLGEAVTRRRPRELTRLSSGHGPGSDVTTR